MVRILGLFGCAISVLVCASSPTVAVAPTADGDFVYHYFKERRPLVLDAARIAVLLDTAQVQKSEPPSIESEELVRGPLDPLAVKSWYFAQMKPEKASVAGVQSAVSRLVQEQKATFTSPVF